MAQWGNSTSNEAKPAFLKQGGYDPERCFADKRGWVYRRLDGTQEVLVAIGSLSTLLGNASIASLTWLKGRLNKTFTVTSVKATSAITISSLLRASNVVSAITSTAHNLTVGQSVIITGSTTFNGTFTVVSAGTATTFTFAQTADDLAVAETGVANSKQIYGVGTKFTTQVAVGGYILDNAENILGTIASIQSDTVLTLVADAAGNHSGTVYGYHPVQTVYVDYNEKVFVYGSAPTFATVGGGAATATYIPRTIAGTITTTTTSTSVVGSSTKFKTDLIVNDIIVNSTGTIIGIIASIQSDTAATLKSVAAVSATGESYNKSDYKLRFDFLPTLSTPVTIAATTFATNGTSLFNADDGANADVTWTAAINTALGSLTIV